MSSLGLEGAELGVLITGDRKMRGLNRAWRGIDRTTDVLSFAMLEGPGTRAQWPGAGKGGRPLSAAPPALTPPVMLGDVVISAPKALEQAGGTGDAFEVELITLLVHGILHLAGYDHEGPRAGRIEMERRQRELTRLITKG